MVIISVVGVPAAVVIAAAAAVVVVVVVDLFWELNFEM